MSLFRTLSLLLLLAGPTVLSATAQKHPIYKLEERLMQGDKTALWEIAPYFDNKQQIAEFLGHHHQEPMLRSIARRMVEENCLFTNEEIVITDSTTTAQFTSFLNSYKESITFSPLATSFLVTSLEKRKARFEIRTITEVRRKQLLGSSPELMISPWIQENHIDSFILRKDPKALLLIASELYRNRSRHNRYQFNGKEYIDLITIMTEAEVGVENRDKEIEWHIEKDYYADARLNLLIYFISHYNQYTWDGEKNIFVNPNHVARALGKEEALLQLLSHKNDTLAVDAFIQLTTCDPEKIKTLVEEYDNADLDRNDALPTFPYRFLKQLSALTAWCRNNNISYTSTGVLHEDIERLKTDLTFKGRRLLEDKLISSLTLDDITAFEYQAAIFENTWDFTYSAGRILDIFYSRNWQQLIASKKHLDCYLKKAALFERMGIIGICNNYLVKFTNSPTATLNTLVNHTTSDKDIQEQAAKAIVIGKKRTTNRKYKDQYIPRPVNKGVPDLQNKLSQLTKAPNTEDNQGKISTLLSQISYEQIGIALKAIEGYHFEDEWRKYSFIERDWGFFTIDNFDRKEEKEAFLQLYTKYSEYQLYAHYLDQAGIIYKKANGAFNYDNIYEMLKHNIVKAFAGGGGGKQDNEVYALIKLLELTFNTRLGFPRKICQSDNMYACYSDDRAQAWMQYLKKKKLLTKEHNDPVSFIYE